MMLDSLVGSNVKEINHDLHQHSYSNHFERWYLTKSIIHILITTQSKAMVGLITNC